MHDLSNMRRDGTANNNNCMESCNNNENCAAFSVYANTCYFKDQNCNTDLQEYALNTIYIKSTGGR